MRVIELLVIAITVYEGLILARALATWFASPYSTHPVLVLLRRVTDPAIVPVQKALPESGGIDLSPLIVLVALELVKRVLL